MSDRKVSIHVVGATASPPENFDRHWNFALYADVFDNDAKSKSEAVIYISGALLAKIGILYHHRPEEEKE